MGAADDQPIPQALTISISGLSRRMLEQFEPLNGASAERCSGDTIELQTPAAPWSYGFLCHLGEIDQPDPRPVGGRVRLDVEIVSGSAGIFLTDSSARHLFGRETILDPSSGRLTVDIDAADPAARWLCVRTASKGPSRVRVHHINQWVRRQFEITETIESLLPQMLRLPGKPALTAIAEALSSTLGRTVSLDEIGALACKRVPLSVDIDKILSDPIGAAIIEETARLCELLPTYDASRLDARAGFLGAPYFEKFLRQSTIRVYHLIHELRTRGMVHGTILEVGSLLGQFAMPLQRLGYDVTVIDRYRAYEGAFSGFVAHMRRAGTAVIETDRGDEAAALARLGQFDAVLCMAVIEHIPHTPRPFLASVAAHVRPDGLLALDTPNVARYWNRRRLSSGASIYPAIEDQFHSNIPFEGHHREYTPSEMRWMLEQVGCDEVRTQLFDYNLLQFDELWCDQIQALLEMTVDSTLCDTILAAGRMCHRPPGRATPPRHE
jgi:2-polyprenyl-3-methyl-5-hydroxy-6-metoxy-1,4-benzoquinol methylase